MAEQTMAEQKLVQYLSEAYGKEKELESTLPLHIELNTRAPYKKRAQQHLRETKNHGKLLERRIKKISGSGVATVSLATGQQLLGRAVPAVKGPLQALRGMSPEEKLLKNAKTEYWNEHEEIATYTAIETLAEQVGDKETAKVAKQIRREEERMADFLAKQIPILTRAVAQAEIPASERKSGSSRRSSSRRRATSGTSRSSSRRASSAAGAKKRTARSSSSRTGAKKRTARSSPSRTGSSRTGSSSKRSPSKRSSTARPKRASGSGRSTSSRSTSSRSAGSRARSTGSRSRRSGRS